MAYSVNPNVTGTTTVGSSAGQIPDAADIEAVNLWMKPTEIDEQEITKWLPSLRAEVNQQTHFIGQSYNPVIASTLENATVSASPTIDLPGSPIDLGFKVGDKVEILDFYPGQTTYFDPTKTTYHRLTVVGATTMTASANVGAIHPAAAVVRVYTSAHPMATAFDTANVFRGDRIAQTVQRLQSGFVKVDKRMRNTPTHESKDHFLDDIEHLRKTMNDKLEGAYAKGTYVPEVGTTPGELRGMLDWADEIGANVLNLSGKQITVHHIVDRLTAKRKTHNKKGGNTVICDLDLMSCLDVVLEPYKLYDDKSNTISIQLDGINTRWGDVTFMPVMNWPVGRLLITSKEDWGAGNYSGMPWTPVQQSEAETGGPWETFAVYGDFTLDCYDVYRQILIDNVNVFVDRYAGRRTYGQSG